MGSDGIHDGLEARVRSAPMPSLEGDRLDLTEPKRWFHRIEAYRHIRITPLRSPSLVPNEMPVMTDRALAPDNDHAFGSVEVLLNVLMPVGPAADAGVPPDREALRLQSIDQWLYPCAVLRLV